jgi:hypothetical protein
LGQVDGVFVASKLTLATFGAPSELVMSETTFLKLTAVTVQSRIDAVTVVGKVTVPPPELVTDAVCVID